MSDEVVVDTPSEPDPDDEAIVAEVKQLAADPPTAKDKVEAALIATKRELRAANRRMKELEPVAADHATLKKQLDAVQPIINAVVTDPKLRAEAFRIAQGKPTSERVDQPTEQDDPEAAEIATELGFVLADGSTPDLVKARRLLGVMDKRNARNTDERIKPFAGLALNQRAEANLRAAAAMTDDDGVPLATEQSIKEVASKLPAHLLSSPDVVDLVLNSAIGLDRRNKRTPKAPDEPLYLDRAGSGGGRRESAVDPELAAMFERQGIDPKRGAAAVKRLEDGAVGRKGIALGVK
jgi:hypothetical protein